MTREVPLMGRRGVVRGHALVDEADFERVEPRRWRLGGNGYAVSGPRSEIYLHRLVLSVDRGNRVQVDHINRDRLDNRRANLRLVAPGDNAQNYTAPGGTSPYRGVHYDKRSRAWISQVSQGGRSVCVGRFASELEAALAAEMFRMRHMPIAEPDPVLALRLPAIYQPSQCEDWHERRRSA